MNRIGLCSACLLALGAAGCGNGAMVVGPDSTVRYIAFGDSTTAGPSERDYPDILRELMQLPADTFANEGAGGETASEGYDRLAGLIESGRYPQAEVILYWEGGNGLVDFIRLADPLLLFSPADDDYPLEDELDQRLKEIQSAVEDSLRAARQAGWDVYVATYFPFEPDTPSCDALPFDVALPDREAHADAYIARLNGVIRDAATAEGATLVDIASWGRALTADPDHYVNCDHLSASGNELVARIFHDFIGSPR